MTSFAHIKRCLELGDRDVERALAERGACKALLEHLSKISKPGDGAPKLLLVFAKLAAAQVDWVDGSLRIELAGDAGVTTVEVLSELGLGMHERVFPSFKMSVPLDEFVRAVERVPHMIAPLAIASKGARRAVLTVGEWEVAEDDGDAFAIGADSLYDATRKQAPIAPMPIVAVDKDLDATVAPRPRAAAASKAPDAPRSAPKVIAARSGNTLPIAMPVSRLAPTVRPRTTPPGTPAVHVPSGQPAASARPKPAAPPPVPPSKPTESSPPAPKAIHFPRPPALPRTGKALEAPASSVVGRVALKQVATPRASSPTSTKARASRPAPARKSKPPARNSKPPGARNSKPPGARASKPPGARNSKPPARPSRPPPSVRKRDVSEAPDPESIDKGWEED